MFTRWMLCLALPFTLAACGDVVIDARTSSNSTTGSAGNGSNGGGSSECPTGDHLAKLGDGGEGATNGIVSDSTGVYWVEEDGTVWHTEPAGASPEVLAKGLGKTIYTITSDADALYVVDYAVALYRIEKSSGAVSMLAQGSFSGVAADEQRVYVTQPDGLYGVDKHGGKPQFLASIDGADSVVVDDTDAYVRANGTTNTPGSVVHVPKAGGTAVNIVPPASTAYHYFSQEIAVDATHVYWINASGGTISRAPKNGGKEEILASGVADPISITLDDGFVYFTIRGKDGGSLDDRAVAKLPENGGAIEYVAHGPQVSAFGIAVDSTNAYWTQHVTGGIVETACK